MRDKLDGHAQAAIDAGRPEAHGFVHIACFLHWLAGRGWLEPGRFSAAERARVADGSIDLGDLIALTDQQLAADMATSEGAEFGEACYDTYLDRWGVAFAEVETDAVPWTAATRARATAVLDELVGAWDADGRPGPAGGDRDHFGIHVHPEVEGFIPRKVAGVPLKVDSFPAHAWGDVSIERLEEAGIDTHQAALVLASHRWDGRGSSAIRVQLLIVPGLDAASLERLLEPGRWAALARRRDRRFGALDVATGLVGDWHVAAWYRDGVAARVWSRSAKRLPLVVEAIDPVLPVRVEVHATEASRGWPAPTEDDRWPHADPVLEALLPAEVMAEPTVRLSERLSGSRADLRAPIERIGFDPDRSRIAGAGGPEQIQLQLVSVPGATAEVLASIAVEVGCEVPGLTPTLGMVGDREVRWLKNPGWTGDVTRAAPSTGVSIT